VDVSADRVAHAGIGFEELIEMMAVQLVKEGTRRVREVAGCQSPEMQLKESYIPARLNETLDAEAEAM